MRGNLLTLTLGVLLLLTGCNRGTTPIDNPNAPAPPQDVIATPRGDAINVTWTDTSENETGFVIYRKTAGEAFIEQGSTPPNTEEFLDTKNVDPTQIYSYAVSAKGQNEADDSDLVEAPNPIQLKKPLPAPVGNTLRVDKLGDGEGSVVSVAPAGIDCGADCSETFQVNPITMTLRAEASAGSVFEGWSEPCPNPTSARCDVTLAGSPLILTATFRKISAPIITTFTPSSDKMFQGQSVTLSWDVAGDTPIELELRDASGNPVDISTKGLVDSVTVTPTATTRYSLTATGAAGSSTAETSVTVEPAPLINSFSSTPATIKAGETATLSWDVSGATIADESTTLSLKDSDGNSVDIFTKRLVDSIEVSPTKTTTYILSALNPAGEVSAAATVTVGEAPSISSFEAKPDMLDEGKDSTLTWATSQASQLVLSDGLTEQDVTGKTSLKVKPATTTTYTLTALNTFGESSRQVTVTVNQKPIISSFTSSKTEVTSRETFTLSWDIERQETLISLELLKDGKRVGILKSPQTVKTIDVVLRSSGALALRATNRAGSTDSAAIFITVDDKKDEDTEDIVSNNTLETVSRMVID